MNLLDDIPRGEVIGLDTAPLTYFVEGNPRYEALVRPLFEERLESGSNTALTSVVSLSEVLAKPLELERPDVVIEYLKLFSHAPNLTLVPVDQAMAIKAAELRAQYHIRLPDAYQIAAVLEHNARTFITNDVKLQRVTDLKVFVLETYLE